MPKGYPLSEEQKQYIIENKESKFINEISRDIGVTHKTVQNFLNKN